MREDPAGVDREGGREGGREGEGLREGGRERVEGCMRRECS